MLNKWCPRPKWDGRSVLPTLSSGIKVMDANKDRRNHVAPGFLCSVSSNGDDFQHQNSVFILSAPYANAGAFSVTPENFERAMTLYTVKKLPAKTWANDRDTFYAPTAELPAEFVADCVAWAAFSAKNNCAALKDVAYRGKTWQIPNSLYPFLLAEVREWPCAHADIAAQLAAANEDRFLATWLAGRALSAEAKAVLAAGRAVYRAFYANVCRTPWMDWKIETWDAGFYQVRNALKGACLADGASGDEPLAALRAAHEALRAKLLPQAYSLGFLNPDVAYFK